MIIVEVELLTKKEQEVMDVLWNSTEEMSTNDIKITAPELNNYTIQQVIKKLLKKGFIKVSGFGYTKNALTRKYIPTLSQADYLQKLVNEKGSLQFVTNYIKSNDDLDTLASLEKLIKEKLKEIED